MKSISHKLTIIANTRLTTKTRLLRLKGDISDITVPGQFVNISIPGKYLRRPISVHRYFSNEGNLELLYDVAGEGTKKLSEMTPGMTLDVLVGLGNGFSIPEDIHNPVLLGGGIGCAPLFQLAIDLVYAGKKPNVILGFNSTNDCPSIVWDLAKQGIPVHIATIDGSEGTKGFVTDVFREKNINFDYFYACGPMPMLRAVSSLPTDGELSLESRMGCGFGICMCCSLETKNGAKRICKEGPVFKKEDLIWK